ncbi:MAG: saccharopine dehydrogenase C-terminal domain-containing protein, partial [Candidatus Hermodarchaeota archaeon]|nr:saccharopine dehydrogenase C-terminal domain-containing protein [Candidatus Hermodarchaeota archaeon]
MAKIPVLLIGCGRMGHGITRMLLQDQRRQNLALELWIYDPYQLAETRCQEDAEYLQLGAIHSLREHIAPENQIILQNLIMHIESNPNALHQTYEILQHAIREVTPRLIINAATFFAQQLYIPLSRTVHCDYIDLGQKLPPITLLRQMDEEIAIAHKGERIVQESGLAPGLANILAVSQYTKVMDETKDEAVFSVQMRVGGLPQHTAKGGPLHYGPSFSPEGLVYEYEGQAFSLREGKLTTTSTFTHPEYWDESNTSPIPFGVQPFRITSKLISQMLETRLHPKHHGTHETQLLLQGLQARPTADGTSRMCFDPRY